MQGREVKYRAHVHQLGWVVEVVAIDFSLREVELDMTRTGDTAYYRFDEIDLIKYTGLRDKNGKEIYEGDILRWTKRQYTSCSREEIESEEIQEVIVYWNETMWALAGDDRGYLLMPYLVEPDAFEVIGNIYENPELLEVGD
ncbi:YopX family protein [Brevibacillus borstelensis]|uniref:YopX family protein n=1 Tax=Brevibacillus borstelensis TaxID=45462 RepID=UPI0030C30E91